MKIALILVLLLSGCSNKFGASKGIVEAQTPGVSSGAGATLVGPNNAAAQTTQTAQRRVAYYPTRETFVYGKPPVISTAAPASAPIQAEQPTQQAAPFHAYLQSPAWIDEKVETKIGQHQDAAGLVTAATAMGSWGQARWFGILLILAGAFGLAWAHNNPEGYPMICWQGAAAGLFLVVFDPSPWWLLVLIVPAGLYAAQKFNLRF